MINAILYLIKINNFIARLFLYSLLFMNGEFFLLSIIILIYLLLYWFLWLWIATGLRPSQWRNGTRIVNSFSFLFLYWLFVVCGLLRFARNDSTHTPSLRGLEKPVAISVWDTRTVKQNSSLQEFRTCGNLSMGYNYWFIEFFCFLFLYFYWWVNSFSFLFLCLLLVVYGACLPL